VLVDGRARGFTDETLLVTRGRHRVSLSPPANFTPVSQTVLATNTTTDEPLLIAFSPRVPGGPAGPSRTTKAAATRKAATKKAAKKR
jgi:hypothetical protein